MTLIGVVVDAMARRTPWRRACSMTRNEAIKQSVQAGLGLGIVSAHTVELEIEVGRLVILNVASFPIMRRWYLVHRKEKRLSATAEAFREFVLAYSDER